MWRPFATVPSGYGTGLLHRVWWYYRFKQETIKAWLVFNQKHASPTAVAKHDSGADEALLQKIDEILESISKDTGVRCPKEIELDLLETAGRAGSGDPFTTLIEYCDDVISIEILGATLTASEGRRSGSLALGSVHANVAHDKIEQDARGLEHVVNRQLIRWIIDFNFGPHVSAPKLEIDKQRDEDKASDRETVLELIDRGLPVGQTHLYERFNIPRPQPGEPLVQTISREEFRPRLQQDEHSGSPGDADRPEGGGLAAAMRELHREEFVPFSCDMEPEP